MTEGHAGARVELWRALEHECSGCSEEDLDHHARAIRAGGPAVQVSFVAVVFPMTRVMEGGRVRAVPTMLCMSCARRLGAALLGEAL